jgi:hypothetical protein
VRQDAKTQNSREGRKELAQSRQELLDLVVIMHAHSGNGGDFRSFSCICFLGRGLTQLSKPLYVFKTLTCVYTHRKYWHSKVRLRFKGKSLHGVEELSKITKLTE